MYPVSAAYIAAMNKAIQRHRISGTIEGVPFASKDVLQDSVNVSNQCSDSKDLTLGGVYTGTLKFTLLHDLGIERGTWKDKTVVLDFELLIDHTTDRWEKVPVGVYFVSEANHTERGIELTCYDNMARTEKEYPQTMTSGKIYDLMLFACQKCGLVFGMTEEECQALPNGNTVLGIYADSGCKTWRDVIHYLAQVVGGFATVDRLGRIVLRTFGNPTGFTVDSSRRLTGSKFSDFITNYTGLSVVNMAEKTTRYISVNPDNGITINLGSNPFMQYGTEDTIKQTLQNILTEINAMKYTPFSSSMVGNPAFDLGDIITYTNGTAGTSSTCCLMAYSWTFNRSYSVQGFGKNPSLATAQSKAEKDLSGLGAQNKSDTIVYFTFENAVEYRVDDVKQNIAYFKITNTKDTFVEFWMELKMAVHLYPPPDVIPEEEPVPEPQAVLEFRYEYDNNTETYHPIMTYNHDGTYTLVLHYYKRMTTIMQHSFNVYLKVNGGVVRIDPESVHAVIKGQGMSEAKAWDGTISVDDNFSLMSNRRYSVKFIETNINTELQIPAPIYAVDEFALVSNRRYTVDFIDGAGSILMQTGIFDLITEDGRQLTTETGDPFITNGGTE